MAATGCDLHDGQEVSAWDGRERNEMIRVFHMEFDRFVELFCSNGNRPGYFLATADTSGMICITAMFCARDHTVHFIKGVQDYEKVQVLKRKGFIPVRRIAE